MKNRGFSLIEIIVVVAIMGVLMSFGGYSMATISKSNAYKCATEINTALETTRTKAYSSDTTTNVVSVTFSQKSDGFYVKKSFETEETKIGGSAVSVTCTLKNGAVYQLSPSGVATISFSFNRSSGGFRQAKINGATEDYCTMLTISGGGSTYVIHCYPKTGKTEVVKGG